jgi:hypothetical protein
MASIAPAAPASDDSEIVVDLGERKARSAELKRVLRASVVSSVESGKAEQKAGFSGGSVGFRGAGESLRGLRILAAVEKCLTEFEDCL